MSAPEYPVLAPAALTGETLIRNLLRGLTKAQRMDIMEATGWKDESSISAIIGGGTGIKLDHLDIVMRVLGLALVEVSYMDYLARGNEIGSRCCKARMSMGSCGAR